MAEKNKKHPPAAPPATATEADSNPGVKSTQEASLPKEIGGRKGPEPTRYGDWEKNGRCIDF